MRKKILCGVLVVGFSAVIGCSAFCSYNERQDDKLELVVYSNESTPARVTHTPYIISSYTDSEPTPTVIPTATPVPKPKIKVKKLDKYLYTQTVLNVRRSYSIDSSKIGCLDHSTMVHITGKVKEWYRIDFKGKDAWVHSDYVSKKMPLIQLSSTAYWDKYNRRSASGRTLVKGYSIAGKVAWLNRSCYIYKCNIDGSVGECLGKFSFDDTGYGASTGYGSSEILDGKTVGTIENGTCIDIYMNNEDECMNYGRRNVYIQFID